ncbi:hypothetical protein FB45DRAFT_289713 [Roridomyces roridus]|uniref:Uncharacterized protein n=1 Tax=Roridomyces roridus TaxID=1738132 RepID=A0AAD7CB87_9AGAR|nr:hypothetical protein FB45DRAFT_289713 [Roridomyces roridus]
MYVPFLTKRRGGGKSGGGGGDAGGGGTSSGGKGSTGSEPGGSTGTGAGAGARTNEPITASGSSRTATSYGNGGGKIITIPSGQLFQGRMEGGGTRAEVFGTRTFGSGYPGLTGRGVATRPFPFFFWPLSFGVGAGATGAYLHSNDEYGHADNTSRPGGPMMTAAFQSNSSTFRILSDNSTVVSLISDIMANCSTSLISQTSSASPYNDTSDSPPQPEQVVQYYRASSIALSLDGYNNTAIFEAEGTPDVALPSGLDTTLLACLNDTIGAAAPMIDGAGSRWAAVPNNFSLLGLIWLVWLSYTNI